MNDVYYTGRRSTALVLPPDQTHFASVKGCPSTPASLLDKLIEREVFVDEQIDKLAQMVFRCDAAAGARR